LGVSGHIQAWSAQSRPHKALAVIGQVTTHNVIDAVQNITKLNKKYKLEYRK